MSETIEIEEGLLDTSIIPEGSEDAGNIIDNGRVFRAAGGVSADELAEYLRHKHSADKYPGLVIVFQPVKNHVVTIIGKKS